jgi:hypothetical protein
MVGRQEVGVHEPRRGSPLRVEVELRLRAEDGDRVLREVSASGTHRSRSTRGRDSPGKPPSPRPRPKHPGEERLESHEAHDEANPMAVPTIRSAQGWAGRCPPLMLRLVANPGHPHQTADQRATNGSREIVIVPREEKTRHDGQHARQDRTSGTGTGSSRTWPRVASPEVPRARSARVSRIPT